MPDWAWIPITIAAAFFQALRTALQKSLTGRLSTAASTLVRSAFGAPFAVLYLAILLHATGERLPAVHTAFLAWVLMGGLAQMAATFLLLHVLRTRNMPVGVAYSKTEVVQAAIFGAFVLGDPVTLWSAAAISVATAGVMLLSVVRSDRPLASLVSGFGERTALLGMASGACFALAAVGVRGASLSLDASGVPVAAAWTLVWVTCLQTLLLGGWLIAREPGVVGRILSVYRPALAAGVTSMLGSACWFTAMSLQTVAHVRTLGLVELAFTFALAAFWFGERPGRREVSGVLLVLAGIAMLLNPLGAQW